jgi:hypothetical protein
VAQAGHAALPLVTDDTGTQDKGRHQVKINTDWVRQAGSSSHVGAATYTFDVLPNLDVFVSAPVTFSSPSGVNDISPGAKWRFFDHDDFSMALKPELLLPSGDPNKGLGTGRTGLAFTLIASYEAAPWSLHVNLGHQ